MGNCESEDMLLGTAVPVLGKLGAVSQLKMVRLRWEKDYQGLFDYDSKEVVKKIYTIDKNSLIANEGQNTTVRDLGSPKRSKENMQNASFEIVRRPNFYKISPAAYLSGEYTVQRKLWMIVKTLPQRRYCLREKDVVKLGKQILKIRQIVHGDSSSPADNQDTILGSRNIYEDLKYKPQAEPISVSKEDNHNLNEVQSVLTENEPTCRVCLEGGELSNPLICPCKCTGSVKYIHLTCLRTWLGRRLNTQKGKYCITIRWIPLTCEMCKAAFPYRIYLDNRKYYTVDIPKPAKPYVVMEVVTKHSEKEKLFHFISCAAISKLSLGRKKDIDVKISEDISISRHHANLLYNFDERQFVLEDNKSKFGTLLLVKKNLLINPHQRGIGFQVSGEVFLFETHRTEGAIPEYKDYDQYLNYLEGKEKEDNEQDSQEGDALDDQEQQNQRGLNINANRAIRADSYNNNSEVRNDSAVPVQPAVQQPQQERPVSVARPASNAPRPVSRQLNELEVIQRPPAPPEPQPQPQPQQSRVEQPQAEPQPVGQEVNNSNNIVIETFE